MKKLINNILWISTLIIALFSGCAITNGKISNSVSLSSNNFKWLGAVEGKSSTVYVFGIGGFGNLVKLAKQNLVANHPLKPGQALANITIDFQTTYVFFIYVRECTITADIVEFYSNPIDYSKISNNTKPDTVSKLIPNSNPIQPQNTYSNNPQTITDNYYYFNKGIESFKNNDYNSALTFFNKLIENNPSFANAFYYRGNTEYKLKNLDGACLDWTQAKKLGVKSANDSLVKYCK